MCNSICNEENLAIVKKYRLIIKNSTTTHEAASELSQIPIDTLKKIRTGKKCRPKTIKKLKKFIDTRYKEGVIDDPEEIMRLGKQAYNSQDWDKMSFLLSRYVSKNKSDSEGHFLLGVAYANINGEKGSDLKALLSYSNAILLAPKSLDKNRKARYLIYRGAMFKRLGKLAKAIKDLKLAENDASNYYEADNIKYNLACIYAMQKEKKLMFEMLDSLISNKMEMSRIKSHLKDYFNNYSNDKEFLEKINYDTKRNN